MRDCTPISPNDLVFSHCDCTALPALAVACIAMSTAPIITPPPLTSPWSRCNAFLSTQATSPTFTCSTHPDFAAPLRHLPIHGRRGAEIQVPQAGRLAAGCLCSHALGAAGGRQGRRGPPIAVGRWGTWRVVSAIDEPSGNGVVRSARSSQQQSRPGCAQGFVS